MAKPGPPKKPTALKRLQGNPGKRPLPKNEPQPDNQKPRCPSHLNDEGKREWRRVAGRLHDVGLLTYVDRALLAAYCQAYGRWVEAEGVIARHGLTQFSPNGYEVKSAWVTISDKAQDQMLKYAREFGLTPSSRASLVVGDDGDPQWSIADELIAAAQMVKGGR